jgi:hypothetical protein
MQRVLIFLVPTLLILACGQPDLLIGSWLNKTPAGEITLLLDKDGALVITAQMVLIGSGVVRGVWERKGDQLQLHFEEDEGFLGGFLAGGGRDTAVLEILTLDESRLVLEDRSKEEITNYTRLSPDTAS